MLNVRNTTLETEKGRIQRYSFIKGEMKNVGHENRESVDA